MAVNIVPITVEDDSIVVQGEVSGQPVTFVLDTGDAIGPTFTAADAQRLGLTATGSFGIEGAGGASSVQSCTADVTLGKVTWDGEPCAIDPDLDGPSLVGLPWFLKECSDLLFAFGAGYMVMVSS